MGLEKSLNAQSFFEIDSQTENQAKTRKRSYVDDGTEKHDLKEPKKSKEEIEENISIVLSIGLLSIL